MDYTGKLENVSVLGAAGKMGSGIVLLTAMEMADLSIKPENKSRVFVLNAVDISQKALTGLVKYLNSQVLKAAEKKISQLRKAYESREDLIENGDIINQYVQDVMCIVRPVTTIESTYESDVVFEAASENPELKVKLFSKINENNKKQPWFLTNTSSIPINEIDQKAKLGGRIIGFHFYNPPAVQKLVEVIKANTTVPDLAEFALSYAKNLRKVVVPSNDFAGFVGNGHFMRDAIYGMNEVQRLTKEMSFVEAVYTINKVTQDYLIRPMGIFQLIDYVGVDVCQYIMQVMNPHVKDEDIHSPLLDKYMEAGVRGGQNSDGSQKDGFLKYEKGKPVAIYDIDKKQYVAIESFSSKCNEKLGSMPASFVSWKAVIGNPKKEEVFKKYFGELKTMNTFGAELAKAYLKRSKEIGLKLVSDKVAAKNEDVNTVLLTGFFHAYGPINDFI
ncbi:MAG: 3-hydroxyacyl-CoA dehydrogenase family protein [Bacteroidales bacterium]|jgi:3-hydroxyacyl-CoA dehydrogenase